ncbi:EscU/YscU/HrcU family type III secretion system export apparatus switch protein [Achromobacter sp. F4_2707]|uniref:EscU/YscU/HrcU family type III secretion system export apparatus switch protein n=1 Tax=Achromobacter sp. F4_2707 TaxID=3114286 RepID=UPI0039C716A3
MSDTDDTSAVSPNTSAARSSAVAIRYDTKDDAPRVVAKGYGNIADIIIRTAQENNLYVHESPELVGLLMQVDLDSQIPPQLYVAIAELLAWIYSLEEKTVEQPVETAAEPAAPSGD